LADAPTKVQNFDDMTQLDRHYVNELKELILSVSRCESVALAGPPKLRSSATAEARPTNVQQAGSFVHADYNAWSAELWLRRMLPANEVEEHLKRRFSIFV